MFKEDSGFCPHPEAPVNNAVLKVAARQELEGEQVEGPPPQHQPHCNTASCQVSLSASPSISLTPQVLSTTVVGPTGGAAGLSAHRTQSSDGQ